MDDVASKERNHLRRKPTSFLQLARQLWSATYIVYIELLLAAGGLYGMLEPIVVEHGARRCDASMRLRCFYEWRDVERPAPAFARG